MSRSPCSTSAEPLGVADPLLKTSALDSSLDLFDKVSVSHECHPESFNCGWECIQSLSSQQAHKWLVVVLQNRLQ